MSIRLLWRRGLLALAAAAAVAVAAPAMASASTTLSTSDTSGVPAGSTSTNLELTYAFSSATANITTTLPGGLLANGTIDGGACLATPASTTPPAACKVGSGNANGGVPFDLYLVQGPHTGDVAGLEVLASGLDLAVADITARPSGDPNGVGLNVAFTSLSLPVTSLDMTLTDMRMPTSCPSPAANIAVSADSGSTTAAFPVINCSSLGYNPALSATVKKDAGDSGAEVISTISQANAATESASMASTLGFGSSLNPNGLAVANCFSPSPACTVGSATATSPLLPVPFTGNVTLGGPSLLTPVLTINFTSPVALSLTGTINLTNNTVTFSNLPDIPLSSLTVDVTGTSAGKAFVTTCGAATLTGTFTPFDGNAAVNRSAQIQYQGCPSGGSGGKPTASGSLSGLPTRHPKLKVKLSDAANISSFSIGPSQGLSFRKCVKKGKKHLCAGVSVSSGTVKSEKISGGRLMVTLSGSPSQVSLTATGPALTESKSLQSKVEKHKIKTITFTVKVRDASGKTSTVLLKVKA